MNLPSEMMWKRVTTDEETDEKKLRACLLFERKAGDAIF